MNRAYGEGYFLPVFDRKFHFLSYENAPLWMRTRAKGNYCLTAIALDASVRQGAHFLNFHIIMT